MNTFFYLLIAALILLEAWHDTRYDALMQDYNFAEARFVKLIKLAMLLTAWAALWAASGSFWPGAAAFALRAMLFDVVEEFLSSGRLRSLRWYWQHSELYYWLKWRRYLTGYLKQRLRLPIKD
ncbi:MAG: hypothetical protein Kow0037_00950 [Calditrichia bacterium]